MAFDGRPCQSRRSSPSVVPSLEARLALMNRELLQCGIKSQTIARKSLEVCGGPSGAGGGRAEKKWSCTEMRPHGSLSILGWLLSGVRGHLGHCCLAWGWEAAVEPNPVFSGLGSNVYSRWFCLNTSQSQEKPSGAG